ncbi:MAG TPA: TraB/GumN family protein [Candidatus Syntrophoarchaeum butanivorans]|uniref:Conjugal transfer protein TraB n=1 Tax=Candidatus Syntropharchaeum butanivorans TaxID=1839936 RepID=A0A1F2P6L4_9EURY|nr:MAG: conjugal transfer protein TraB [Candidatus Syntrophoarchaeum butanivorans]HEC57600.1 TraB/GumN family protein [Candidatus Syntrophoarchaeum butanivorans]
MDDGNNKIECGPERRIRIVGTAHVSERSVREVRDAIEEVRPDVVAVELCRARYRALKGDVEEISIKDVIKSGNIYLLLLHYLLAYVQRKIGQELGVEPGADMLAAIEEAERRGIPVALIDRDIGVTMQRFWGKMKLREKLKMLFAIIISIAGIGKDEIEIERITDADIVSQLIKELRRFSPSAAEVLIDERDAYIANQLLRLQGNIVAVVGAGHVEGIRRYLENPDLIREMGDITSSPKRRINLGRVFGLGVFIFLMVTLIIILTSGAPLKLLLIALLYWIVINGVLSAGGVILARGHPLSVLTAFAVAWLTSLYPMIAAGWFAGLVEAWVRSPAPSDIRKMIEVESLSELMRNPIFRVLLVAAFANIGSLIGTFLGVYVIFNLTGINLEEVARGVFSRWFQ